MPKHYTSIDISGEPGCGKTVAAEAIVKSKVLVDAGFNVIHLGDRATCHEGRELQLKIVAKMSRRSKRNHVAIIGVSNLQALMRPPNGLVNSTATLTPCDNASILGVAIDACRIANSAGVLVGFIFQGVICQAGPGTVPEQLVERWRIDRLADNRGL